MSAKFRYYAIVGSNGYGICRSWGDYVSCQKYFRAIQVKGFWDVEEAYDWITTEFAYKYAGYFYEFCELEELLKRKLVFVRRRELCLG